MSLSLTFYQDAQPHSCSYLSEQLSQNLYPDPAIPITNDLYSELIQHGFRRSGNSSYRPHCPACNACVPVRINIAAFRPNRSQRRCLKRNSLLSHYEKLAVFSEEYFSLYTKYLNTRHANAGMDIPTPESYRRFLLSNWSDTLFIEFRDAEKLVGIAVTDKVEHALSAFYTFFDPDYAKQSLGTYAILQQIELAKTIGLSYVYLGYYISDCQKMSYKKNFSGLEGFIDHQWQALD